METLSIDTELFADQGYVVFPGAFDIAALRDQLADKIAADVRSGAIRNTDDSLRPKNILELASVRSLVTDPRLLGLVCALFPADPILCSLGANRVLPGASGMGIHKDYPYFSRQKQSTGGPLLCVQLVLSMNGMTADNGATTIFPGSHRGALARPVPVLCEPGTLVLFHGALTHNVAPNRSALPRTNVLASFSPHWVRPFSDLVSDRTPAELADPVLRHLLGLDFIERVNAQLPYGGFGKQGTMPPA